MDQGNLLAAVLGIIPLAAAFWFGCAGMNILRHEYSEDHTNRIWGVAWIGFGVMMGFTIGSALLLGAVGSEYGIVKMLHN